MKTLTANKAAATHGDAAPPAADSTRRRVNSADLLGSAREIQIEHAGELYTLRQTSKGKLILTK